MTYDTARKAGSQRLAIFVALVPPIVLAILNAPDVVMRHDVTLLDLLTLSLAYTFLIIPALMLAWVDQIFRSRAATTIAGLAMAFLAALGIGFAFTDVQAVLMIGLMGSVPAAVCSWLSHRFAHEA